MGQPLHQRIAEFGKMTEHEFEHRPGDHQRHDRHQTGDEISTEMRQHWLVVRPSIGEASHALTQE
jgi:hypothetical protein